MGVSLAWRLENAHITLNMFQNRFPFFYNSSAFLLSFSCIVWISFYPGTSSLEPFSLFYDLIASYYTKGKWQWRQGYLFCFESHHFDNHDNHIIFLLLIWRVHLIKSCLVWKQKFAFVIDKCFNFFQMLLGYNFHRIDKDCNKNMNWGQG